MHSFSKNDYTVDFRVRLHVLRSFIDHGQPPTAAEIGDSLSCCQGDVEESLERLAKCNSLILFPNSKDIHTVHPFSAVPTAFRVEADGHSWWASCAWCSLGIPALLKADARIFSVCGDCQRPIRWEIRSGELLPVKEVIHFTVLAAEWWKDLVGACNTILGFHSEDHVNHWLESHHHKKGVVLSPEKVWQLAQAWFSDLLNPDLRGINAGKASEFFKRLGLTGDFWNLPR